MSGMKLATCCYCGLRAALVLTGTRRQELSCAGCGAPLHDLKVMPMRSGGASARAATPARPARTLRVEHKPVRKLRKRRSGLGRKLFEDLWDAVEDIVDDILD